jgi:hypothetical protein
MSFLDRKPVMADVIAWVLAVPAIILGLSACPYMLWVMSRFELMFLSLHAKLPQITIFILTQGWWFFTLLPIVVVAGLLIILVRCSNGLVKVTAAFVAGQIVTGIIGSAVAAIFCAVIELQKQLK